MARPAVRPALKARAMLSGPAGAGKTRTGLIVAAVLAADEGGTVLVIDTEKESALTYADDFEFEHLKWLPPFDPRELASVIMEAGQKHAVVMIDSASHFWRGDGGVLDIAGGKFTGWKDARPAHADLVEAFLAVDAHLIVCARSKMDHVQEVENGRHVVRKLGMAAIQDDELEYELNVACEFDMDHSFTVSKSRTVAVPVGRSFKAGHAEDFAALYRDWLKGGEPPAEKPIVLDLKARMDALPHEQKVACKQEFMAQFGRPEQLRESQVLYALGLVDRWEDLAAPVSDVTPPPSADAGEPSGDGGEAVSEGEPVGAA
jgi:hypothetical protein